MSTTERDLLERARWYVHEYARLSRNTGVFMGPPETHDGLVAEIDKALEPRGPMPKVGDICEKCGGTWKHWSMPQFGVMHRCLRKCGPDEHVYTTFHDGDGLQLKPGTCIYCEQKQPWPLPTEP